MRYKNCIYILFILVSCSTQRVATTSKLMLFRIDTDGEFSDNQEVQVDYNGLYNENYIFQVLIRNNSTDSIFVNPASFKYRLITGKMRIDTTIVNAINPEERIEQLKIQKDSLKNNTNPYSLAGKSVKEIATEGLISGTIVFLFGQNAEELESQRLKNEDSWEEEQSLKKNKVNAELQFWNTSALLPFVIPPNNTVSGMVLFPVSLNTNEIKIEIPIQNNGYNFLFKNSN